MDHSRATDPAVSYRAVLSQPGLARMCTSMLLSRTADSMWTVLVVLYALLHFHSPLLAGVALALGQVPNKLIAPLVGSLLDRHGRRRLVFLDYLVATISLGAVGILGLVGELSETAFLSLCAVAGLTSILSATGLRSLFPLLLPRAMWDRANAIDSVSYIAASMVGPALGGLLVGIGGGEIAILLDAGLFACSVVACLGIPDPASLAPSDQSIWRAAWSGIVYVVGNRTLCGLALILSAINFGVGASFVALPVLVIGHFGGSSALVGGLFVISSAAALISSVLFGRWGSEGHERGLILGGTLGFAATLCLLSWGPNMGVVVGALVLFGICNGPIDIGLFALRQRRTAPAMLGRAMAISMALNGIGNPLGSLTSGSLVRSNVSAAFLVAAVVALVGAATIFITIPREA